MSSNFQIDITSLGLKKNYLYEIIATTLSIDKHLMVPNTASMGIRIVDEKNIDIRPYPNTTTYKNIEKSKFIILNFVDDVYLYALASLKGSNLSKSYKGLSEDYYNFLTLRVNKEYMDFAHKISSSDSIRLPYLKNAWAIVVCVATNETQVQKLDNFGKIELMALNLAVISYEKFKESFKLYNRAENLALETIILATKLRVAGEKKDETLIRTIKNKIDENYNEIYRFGKNLSALKTIEFIQDYIEELED